MFTFRRMSSRLYWLALIGALLYPTYYWLYSVFLNQDYENLALRLGVSLCACFIALLSRTRTDRQCEVLGLVFIFLFVFSFTYISAKNNHPYVYLTGLLIIMSAYPFLVQRIGFFYIFSALSLSFFALSHFLWADGTFSLDFGIKLIFIHTFLLILLFISHAWSSIQKHTHSQDILNKAIVNALPGYMWSIKVKEAGSSIHIVKTLFVSDQWVSIYGVSPLMMERDPYTVRTLIFEKDKPRFDKALREVKYSGEAQFRHRVVKAGTQEIRFLETRMVGNFSKNNTLTRIDAMSLDITEMTQLEEQITDLQQNIIQMTSMLRKRNNEPLSSTQPQRISPAALLEDSLAALRPYIESKGIHLTAETLSPNVRIMGHAHLLEQVMHCVLNNAIDAIARIGSGHIGVKIAQENQQAVISISDTGIGIEKNHRAQIFKPFFTTKASTNHHHIGLSISKRIIEDHGGTLTFTSIGSGGTTFDIRLPACEQKTAKIITL